MRIGAARRGVAREAFEAGPLGAGSTQTLRAAAVLLALALALGGCETNEERHAQMVRQDRLVRRDVPARTQPLVARESRYVKVLGTTVLHDENGTAAVVRLRNDSPHPLRDVPISITLREPDGGTLYQNDLPGLGAPLTHAPLLLPGESFDWIDDQIPGSGAPGALRVRVGEVPAVGARTPSIAVSGVRVFDDPTNGTGAQGTVVNRSAVAQQELVVFAVGLRAGRIVAAGRAVLPDVPANSSAPFQVFFIGNPEGASLQVSAPPTTLG